MDVLGRGFGGRYASVETAKKSTDLACAVLNMATRKAEGFESVIGRVNSLGCLFTSTSGFHSRVVTREAGDKAVVDR